MYRFVAFCSAMLLTLGALLLGCDDPAAPPPDSPPDTGQGIIEYTYEVQNTYPHDETAFTQGLVWADTALLEGTGITGLSSLRRTRLETGEILQIRQTPISAFGEGITLVEDRIYQLTWQKRVAFVYDAATFDSIGEFHYSTEGWGLTHDGQRFIMSDGTSTIYFRDFGTFDITGTIQVTDENGPVSQLNELEYIHGKIFANVWTTDYIVIISPDTGDVLGRIDCSGLLENARGVLNGIAFDQENGRLFVTGKNWPSLFHIRFLKKE